MLASKPEERRELVEEAAGLGKFKRRRHRAELKLGRVGIQVERASDVEAEVRKRLRPLALQATAAERAEKFAGEIAGLRARIAELDLEAAEARRTGAEERKTAAGLGRRSAQEKLQALLTERQAAEEELADAAGRREAAIKALYRLQGATERIALRQEGSQDLLGGCEQSSARPRRLRAGHRRVDARARAGGGRSHRRRSGGWGRERRGSGAGPRGPGTARVARTRSAARAEERLESLRGERQRSKRNSPRGRRPRGCDRRALPARDRAPADRDARRVRLGVSRASPHRAGRVGRCRPEARAVARRARARGKRCDRGGPDCRPRTRRPHGAGGDRQ